MARLLDIRRNQTPDCNELFCGSSLGSPLGRHYKALLRRMNFLQ
jgi:hypothetical protein